MTDRVRVRRAAMFAFWLTGLVGALALQAFGSSSDAPASLDETRATVLAPRTARVTRVMHKAGDAVTAGTPVAELDPAEVELEIALQKVELERLNNEVLAQILEVQGSDFEAGARLEIEAERAALDLSTLVAEEKRDRAELEALDAQIKRQAELVEKKLASAELRDELTLRRAAISERVGESARALASARAREDAARKRLKDWRATHTVSGDDRSAPQRAAVRAQEERLKQLEIAKAALVVKAPIDGVLSELVVPEGGTVRAGEPVVVVMARQSDRATAWVDESASSLVRVGDRSELRAAEGRGGVRTGTVRALGAGVVEIPARFWAVPGEPVFGRAVFVDLDPGGDDAIPGQRMEARFQHP
jgi:multidrug resistance efflux pump